MTNKETKLMIIENFIDHLTTNETERKILKVNAAQYVEEDWVDEINPETDVIKIPVETLVKTMNAMAFTFAPYIDDEGIDLKEYPWVLDLVKQYNALVELLPTKIAKLYFFRKIIL